MKTTITRVQNERIVSTHAAKKAGRKFSTFDLAKYFADPIGQGLNTISFISAGTQTSKHCKFCDE